MLDTFGVQLARLSPNSVVILAIFAHFCEMPSSVALFWNFFVLRAAGKKKGSAEVEVVGYRNFRLREGLGKLYISQVLHGKWEDRHRDWVYVDVNPHDRLTLPQTPTEPHRQSGRRPPWRMSACARC